MNVALHLFIPPIGKFDAGGINGAMSLVGIVISVTGYIRYNNYIFGMKRAMLALRWAIKVHEFGY